MWACRPDADKEISRGLAPAQVPCTVTPFWVIGCAASSDSFSSQFDQDHTAPAVGEHLQLVQAKHQQASLLGQAGHRAGVRADHPWWQWRVARFQRHERFTAFQPADHVAGLGRETIARRGRHQQRRLAAASVEMVNARAAIQVDQRGDWHTIATRAGQGGHRHGIHLAVVAKPQQRIDRAAFKRAVQRVARLERELRHIVTNASARAYPAFFRNDDGDRFIDHLSGPRPRAALPRSGCGARRRTAWHRLRFRE